MDLSPLSDKFSQSYSHLGIYPDKMAFGQGVLVIEGKSYSSLYKGGYYTLLLLTGCLDVEQVLWEEYTREKR
jgi:hypothetical protein